MKKKQDQDLQLEQVFHYIDQKAFYPGLSKCQKSSVRKRAASFIKNEDNQYFFIGLYGKNKDSPRLFARREDRPAVMRECHDNAITGGHFGRTVTQKKIKSKYYWRGITKDVKNWIQRCEKCQRLEVSSAEHSSLRPTPSYEPWQIVGMDFIGPLPKTKSENEYICVLIDHFSKFIYAEAIPSKQPNVVGSVLFSFICLYGPPTFIITDRGKEFCNALNKELLRILQVKHTITLVCHPQYNESVEKTGRTLKTYLLKYMNESQSDWDQFLKALVLSINTSYQATTKHTPYEVLFKRKVNWRSETTKEVKSPEQHHVEQYMSAAAQIANLLEAKVGE